MTQGTPLPAAHEFFNVTANLNGPVDAKLATPMVWQAGTLDRKNPNNFATKVAFARVLLITGQRELAIDQLNAAFNLRNIEEFAGYSELARLLTGVGDLTRAGSITRDLLREFSATVKGVLSNAACFALRAGDIKLLEEIAAMDSSDFARRTLEILTEGNLETHLEEHQKIVQEVLDKDQVWLAVTTVVDDEGDATIVMEHVLSGDPKIRRKIQRNLVDRLAEYYESQKMPPGGYMPFFDTLISLVQPHSGVVAA